MVRPVGAARRPASGVVVFGVVVVASLLACACAAAPDALRGGGGPRGPRGERRKRRGVNVTVDQARFHAAFDASGAGRRTRVSLPWKGPSGAIECNLGSSRVMSPELEAKFPTLRVLSGPCVGGGSASVTVDTARPRSFSATVWRGAATHYLDAADDSGAAFTLYNASGVDPSADEAWRCGGALGADHRDLVAHDSSDGSGRSLLSSSSRAYTFRLAVLANKEYSQYHGGIVSSVMAALATMLTRVNGVFVRELGIEFQFIGAQDRLICNSTDGVVVSWCESVPNDDSLLNGARAVIESRGVAEADYDLGHSVSTNSGGRAGVGVLCLSGNKARGTTGLSAPNNDPFYIDFVAHEMGHQLGAPHTFRDCASHPSNHDPSSAFEPGSGSTIMSYAGSCGSSDLQFKSDAYYHPSSLLAMRGVIEATVATVAGCGSSPDGAPVLERPAMDVLTTTCVVPKGSSVALDGSSPAASPTKALWYSWDNVESAPAAYADANVPRFRSWSPTLRSKRFLPNMHQLTFNYTSWWEIAPKASVAGDVTMVMRFTGRTVFSATGGTALSGAGTFGYSDLRLVYDASAAPLEWLTVPASLQGDADADLTWQGGNTEKSVDILIALVTMSPALTGLASPSVKDSLNSAKVLDYTADIKDLEWVLIETVPNSGSARVRVPYIPNPTALKANLMIRETRADPRCYHFALAPARELEEAACSSTPTGCVTKSPTTLSPTVPTISPTRAPSAPTIPVGWSCSASYYNAKDGCDCQCGAWDPDCDTPGSNLFCNTLDSVPNKVCDPTTLTCVDPTQSLAPTKAPTRAPTTRPTTAPTSQPTRAPTTKGPSKAPTFFPTRKPTTSKPTARPSKTPTSRPTRRPSTRSPSRTPTTRPTRKPTKAPTSRPMRKPTI